MDFAFYISYTHIQVLVLKINRIRKLTPASFAKYEDMVMLYLIDNMIQTIEANTFSRMQSLEVSVLKV